MPAAASRDTNDLGVIGYFTPAGGQTAFNDRNAKPVVAVAIAANTWQASSGPLYCGRAQALTVTLHGALAPGQTCKVRLEVARIDPANPTIWPDAIAASAWSSILSARGDVGTPAVEHTILPAALVSTFDGASKQDVVLQTSSQFSNGQVRVIVEFTQAGGGIDLLVITANVADITI